MKNIPVLLACLLFMLTVRTDAQEAIALTAPITQPTISNYVPASLTIQVQPVPRITVIITDVASGRQETFSYPCPSPCANSTDAQVTTLIANLNTANLTTRSLWRRVFDRLLLDFPSRFVGGATVQ